MDGGVTMKKYFSRLVQFLYQWWRHNIGLEGTLSSPVTFYFLFVLDFLGLLPDLYVFLFWYVGTFCVVYLIMELKPSKLLAALNICRKNEDSSEHFCRAWCQAAERLARKVPNAEQQQVFELAFNQLLADWAIHRDGVNSKFRLWLIDAKLGFRLLLLFGNCWRLWLIPACSRIVKRVDQ